MTRRTILMLLAVAVMLPSSGCQKIQNMFTKGKEQTAKAALEKPLTPLARTFLAACPKPQWWDQVEGVEITTCSDLMTYWQGQAFSKEELFKTCYEAMLYHMEDPDIAVTAASLISNGDPTYRHYGAIYRFILDHYYDYERPLANYSGKAGDSIAGIVEDYAGILLGKGENEEARDLLETLFSKRKGQVNPQMMQLLSIQLAHAYEGLGDRDSARRVLTTALTYPGDWDDRINKELASLD